MGDARPAALVPLTVDWVDAWRLPPGPAPASLLLLAASDEDDDDDDEERTEPPGPREDAPPTAGPG
jgi:hypothetical protein